MQTICQNRMNSVNSNCEAESHHIDEEWAKRTEAWVDKYGHQIVAEHLRSKVFRVQTWYVEELRVRFNSCI